MHRKDETFVARIAINVAPQGCYYTFETSLAHLDKESIAACFYSPYLCLRQNDTTDVNFQNLKINTSDEKVTFSCLALAILLQLIPSNGNAANIQDQKKKTNRTAMKQDTIPANLSKEPANPSKKKQKKANAM